MSSWHGPENLPVADGSGSSKHNSVHWMPLAHSTLAQPFPFIMHLLSATPLRRLLPRPDRRFYGLP
jgi:hypothetical protein